MNGSRLCTGNSRSMSYTSAITLLSATTVALLAVPSLYRVICTWLSGRRAQVQLASSQFVLSAGAVSFLFVGGVPKKVLLVHHTAKNQWLLAKGRKDQGEELAAAALREVFEETGYKCALYPARLPTRAPPPSVLSSALFQPDVVRITENSTEPFAITIRPTGPGRLKLIFWYIGRVVASREDTATATTKGSHMAAEGFDSAGLFDIDDALQKLTYEGDRDLVRTAIGIIG
ncbi:hypothetical protein C8Q79DRAFT_652140 [Trametes meyenii]|nr:hypothetical protein C8Q79DRAFT_652140 [Trametes meyenii]